MLQPILTIAQEWSAPEGIGVGPPVSHFAQRCAERGLHCVHGDLLKWVVERAVAQRCEDVIEAVFCLDDDTRVFRILLPEGAFYPIIRQGGIAVTIYTPGQMAQVRTRRKQFKKRTGKRARPTKRRAGA